MPRLKVMTLNVWGYQGDWTARRGHILRAMQDEELDVVLLQEVADRGWRLNQAAELAHMTGYAMAFMSSQRFWPWPSVATGLAILSRFPISSPLTTEITPSVGLFPSGPNERRIAQRVEVAIDSMSVVIYNTHFPLDAAKRLAAAYRLWSQVVQEEAVLVVVGGDFNALPNEQCVDFLQGKVPLEGMRGELADAWATAGVGPQETYPVHAPKSRIDYIFYQAEPTVIVQETKVIGYQPDSMSDHAAVVATFAISPTREMEEPRDEEPVASLEPAGGGGGFGGFFP